MPAFWEFFALCKLSAMRLEKASQIRVVLELMHQTRHQLISLGLSLKARTND